MTPLRCAIYTRVSTEHGLDQEFNSLDNQREAAEAYVKSQAHEGWRLLPGRYDDGGFSGGSMERPALQRLLDQVRQRRVDVIVVYKVDRLTRSLADFAKLVELFDANGVSFVSVTQAFNTTTSMGRLTLNVLLSFAQFEREVTGERIRDKIAASKRRGLWVGGMVPLGYRVETKKLVVVDEEADTVRFIFDRYLELGSLGRLLADLRARGIVTKTVMRSGTRVRGGIPFARGSLAYLLRNRFYLGEVVFKGQVYPAEHPAILDRAIFESVQARLTEQRCGSETSRASSGALLAGRLFDERGRRMTPTHATKAGRRYRYYITAEPTDGVPIRRIAATSIEAIIEEAARGDPKGAANSSDPLGSIVRVDLATDHLVVTHRSEDGPSSTSTIPWSPASTRRHRELIAVDAGRAPVRRMRAETRSTLLTAIARGRRWMQELASGAIPDTNAIAEREGCSARQVAATLSLASLAPDLVEAAISGRLPHGIGLRQLTDAPLLWSRQRAAIGIRSSADL